MKASVLRTGSRAESRSDRSLGIQTYGQHNDYPQRCKEIADASGTGKSCINIYAKFIQGKGFANKNLYKAIINRKGQTTDYILQQIARDYADYGGFALHVNYNALYQIVEVQHVPFETIRFEKPDDETGTFARVATHPDWGRRHQSIRKFRKEDIKLFNLYNPNPHTVQTQVDLAGNWESYPGQIYYYSSAGEKAYPVPIYDAVLTDMSTEEGVSNVKNRNTRNNFLPAGMIIDKRNRSQDQAQAQELEESFLQFQTDENACKLIMVQVESEEEAPVFQPFESANYDKEFDYTEQSVQQNIGRAFNQPPVLRAEDVSGGFGADLIVNAYNVYNSVTTTERYTIERVFTEIFAHFQTPVSNDYSVQPLSYVPQITSTNIAEITNIVSDSTLSAGQKTAMLQMLFNISSEDAALLVE